MTTNINNIFKEIDNLTDKYIQMLVDICIIESKTEDKESVDKVGKYLERYAEKMGYKIVKKEFEKSGDVYSFTLNEDDKKELISMSGHMDTVFEKGAFGYPPVKMDEEFIYGPGVQDCKGGIVISLLVMEALKNCGYDKRQVKLILQSDEEVGSCLSNKGTIDFMLEEAKNSIAFLNMEGHNPGKITVGRKGIVKKKILIKGHAAHSGIYIGGISAIREAAHKIINLEEGNDPNGITFNCGIIKGGTTINTIPENCEIDVEYRFKTLKEQQTAEEKLQKIVNTSFVEGTTATVISISDRSPMERTAKNENLANRISDISEKYGFEKLEPAESSGGADAAYTTVAGIPTIDSVGIEGANCHSVREKARLSSVSKLAKILAAVIIEV